MRIYTERLSQIIKDKNHWSDLKIELSKYNIDNRDEKLKDTSAGKIFEVFAKYYFLTAPEFDGLYTDIWLYHEIPLKTKEALDLGTVEYGIDLLLKTINNKYVAVQCKFKNDETSRLNWSADKIANLFAYCPKADSYILFSNCASLDNVSSSRTNNFTFYNIGHLLEIEQNTFENILIKLNDSKPKDKVYLLPKPHQQKAIDECVQWFTEGEESRGQLILPCGAGKTLTSLWIKEELKSQKTLILVPSLALLRQIKNEWSKQRKTIYEYLCVCSETDIDGDNQDSILTHTYEIGGNVTTNPEDINLFLSLGLGEKVIFSTYQSLPVIVESLKNTEINFDFVFCDEAHKTAGISKGVFGIIHDNTKIPAKKRLYATATPRIVKESLKKKLGDDLKYTHDMNDPKTFGEEFFRMSFKDAIDQDILVDYKIIAIGVNDKQLSSYLNERRYVNNNISIDEVANNYALDFVMSKYSANHALTFHSRVNLAKDFSLRHSKLFETTNSFSVDGTQATSIRNQILHEFKSSNKAIISNARCLTEGVDVPTIDLVYFSDPKNSKVDIIQAVGRALRKKEGKKQGYIVVPIYHTNHGEVENSISEGSFKNLLQVIRSLCEQDERLQDEINSIAFGKGKKGSKRIDILSSFDEEIETLNLIGFEQNLRESLFDQIIYKTSNNWDIWFLELKTHLELNNDYPSKNENANLYAWVAQQRNRKNSNTLKLEELRKLNSINFAWDIVRWKWYKMFEVFKSYAEVNEFSPHKDFDNPDLVNWYKIQLGYLNDKKYITNEQLIKFQNINSKFLGSGSKKKWVALYEDLVKWRSINSDRWPQYQRDDKDSYESKLSVFCQTIRKRFRENDLEDYWYDKFTELGFNFEGKADTWTDYFFKIKNLLQTRTSISIDDIGQNEYTWIYRHRKDFSEGKLTEYQCQKIKELSLDRFFETWEQSFEKIKKWQIENLKLPTRNSNKDLHSWLNSQRSKYKNGTLSEEQIISLQSIGYYLEGKGNQDKEDRWLEMFNNLVDFKKKNSNDWPKFGSDGLEAQLYNWCQANRQAQAGTHSGGRRKELEQWKVIKLDELNFHWAKADINNRDWEINFEKFIEHLDSDGNFTLPSMVNGEINLLYRWFTNQRVSFQKNKMPSDRIQKFKEVGVSFEESENLTKRDGYSKWAKNINKIAKFIETNGHYPKAGTDTLQANLYQSLARTKRAFNETKLSEEQIALLRELNIKID
ncbi:Mrr restriction endonuclease-like protein [Flavobacterium sp. 1]|uniref:DEAD/DEAH box helicase n=1 Tax=Flavobacterium sp. 1 TaxID=2035200 RepID=UPI000C236F39|nr:DEAD/DEAH box helicase [Flavobacterium sp. 1]PJJ09283.1 Mrr restriction endonuclease-like protein [Flavobacterium sp. 1]